MRSGVDSSSASGSRLPHAAPMENTAPGSNRSQPFLVVTLGD
jgi:hypothetical protein